MKTRKTRLQNCTILRTMTISQYTLNIVTGETREGQTYVTTEPCNTPLFTEDEMATGICRSCRSGWETAGNEFANEAERTRATS